LGLWLVRNHRSPAFPSEAPRRDYRKMIRDVRLWLFPLALGGAAFSIFSTFGPLLLHHRFGFDNTASEVAIAVWILAGALVAFFFGRVSRRFGRLRTLTACYAFIGIACLVGVVSGSAAIVLGLFWTFGSAVFITYPALFSFVSEASHRRLQGAAFGIIFGFQLLGGSLGSFAAGALAASFRTVGDFEATGPFYFLGLLALVGFAYLLGIRKHVRDPGGASIPRVPEV